jgi:hypothetical protein
MAGVNVGMLDGSNNWGCGGAGVAVGDGVSDGMNSCLLVGDRVCVALILVGVLDGIFVISLGVDVNILGAIGWQAARKAIQVEIRNLFIVGFVDSSMLLLQNISLYSAPNGLR